MKHSLVHRRLLVGPILCRPGAFKGSSCEFMTPVAFLRLADGVLQSFLLSLIPIVKTKSCSHLNFVFSMAGYPDNKKFTYQ